MTHPPAAFEDEQLDAALLSVLGEPAAAAGDADGSAATSPRGVARSLAGSRRASATLGLAAVGAIAGLAFLTLARDDPPEAPSVRAAPPSQRTGVTSVASALASAAPAPLASPPVVAATAPRLRSIARPAATLDAVARVARTRDRPAGLEQVTRRPAVVLTDEMVGTVEPAAIAISAPVAPPPEPTASMMVDPGPPPAATALSAPTRRARRDSVVAIRSFRRQW